ncbi:MAG: hypothetical protein LKF31_03570 [Muribaculaceae bacterium]|jgi:hypothetical protein|nr:hypothetical protein [Muribaculaceae bacterium]
MKQINILSIFLLTLLFAACTQSPAMRRGKAIGAKIVAAASSSNSAALNASATEFKAAFDSIHTDSVAVADLIKGVNSAATDNDTVKAAIGTVVYSPNRFGEITSAECIDNLLSGSKTPQELFRRISIAHAVYSMRGMLMESVVFDLGFQKHIDSLPLSKQMQVYSKACSPEKLGKAMHNDALNSDPAAQARVNDRIKELRTIYSADEYNAFMKSYNSK